MSVSYFLQMYNDVSTDKLFILFPMYVMRVIGWQGIMEKKVSLGAKLMCEYSVHGPILLMV